MNLRVQPPSSIQPSISSSYQGPDSPPDPLQGPNFSPSAGPPSALNVINVEKQNGSPKQQYQPQLSSGGPPQLPTARPSTPLYSQASTPAPTFYNNDAPDVDTPPPSKPVFGISLDDLLRRDGSAIPLVVYQCLQAVDLFGLEVEGIYRLSGSTAHVARLRAIFDHGMTRLYSAPGEAYADADIV